MSNQLELQDKLLIGIKFNLWVFWHHIRLHKMEVKHKTLKYPYVEKRVTCFTCMKFKKVIYSDGLENYH